MKKINFVFCVHNHQPVGNFDFVFEDALEEAYLPFLTTLSRHPSIKMALHVSGALLEWMENHRPDYLLLIRELAQRGQLEIMTGGFYEPILPSVPDEDKSAQILKLSSFIEEKFGSKASGLWLAERVWEPTLPSVLAKSGVEFTVVDDSHFKSAGLSEGELFGYYLTEDEGSVIKIFSGSKRLRYLIPFANPEETLTYMREKASESEGALLVFADDGEKFGVWPGTAKLCYEEKWLEKFLVMLEENSDWVNVVTFSEYVSRHGPLGWVFLPTASYAEMMEWCLPVEAQVEYHEFLGKLKAGGHLERYEGFVKGGFWRNFFTRYPESNWMHKRMLFARRNVLSVSKDGAERGSVKSRNRSGPEVPERVFHAAMNEVWRAQCNCAYWHGVFGGLYLPHLREAIYRHLLRAENMMIEARGASGTLPAAERVDVDGDGEEEILLQNREIACFVSPGRGGAVVELDLRPRELNLINTLARRREAYHSRMAPSSEQHGTGSAESIHDAVKAKEEKLEKFLFYDRFPRACFLDHFLSPETSPREAFESRFDDLGDFARGSYAVKEPLGEGRVVLHRTGIVRTKCGDAKVGIEKILTVPPGRSSVAVSYSLSFPEKLPLDLLFVSELNLLIPSGGGAHCRAETAGSGSREVKLLSPAEFESVSKLEFRDENVGLEASVAFDRPAVIWQFPVQSVSLSESGLERVYQATCAMAVWPLASGTGAASFDVLMEFGGPGAAPAGPKKAGTA